MVDVAHRREGGEGERRKEGVSVLPPFSFTITAPLGRSRAEHVAGLEEGRKRKEGGMEVTYRISKLL